MKKKNLLAGLSLVSSSVFASTLASAQSDIIGSLSGITSLIQGMSYMAGAGMGISAALSLKIYNETCGREAKLSAAVTKMMVSAGLLALPHFLNASSEMLLGQDYQSSAIVRESPRSPPPVVAPAPEQVKAPSLKKDVSPEGWDAKVGNSAWSVPPQN